MNLSTSYDRQFRGGIWLGLIIGLVVGYFIWGGDRPCIS